MDSSWYSILFGGVYLALIMAFALNIIMHRRSVGVSLAWLVLVFALPVAGFVCYLLFGPRRLGTKRIKRLEKLHPDYEQWSDHLTAVISGTSVRQDAAQQHSGIYTLSEQALGIPVMPSSNLQLFHETDAIIDGILQDIERAKKSIALEFYIWDATGRGRELAEALVRAARRGVDCVVVLDGVGSRRFLRHYWGRRFRLEGISVTESLPVGLLRMLVERIDIRNHRKILAVDDDIAWTGSFNLVDPKYFKTDANVGRWVDAMVRMEGVAAHVMSTVVHWDRTLETGEPFSVLQSTYEMPRNQLSDNRAPVHIMPSGPDGKRESIHQVLLTAIYESKEELLISTPYFVPDEALLTALRSAAMRGVDVQLLVPEKNDSRMVHYASRSYYEELLNAGVSIQQFKGGLLHTKCVLVDRSTILFGTVNLDMRSVWLNFEVTLIIYDRAFSQTMALLLESYIALSEPVEPSSWVNRPFRRKLLENTMQLISPLL
ncbi:cardiolipin synthase [Endozoicomonas euniceicola]|uniref:Cardiolipin synthase n=1 Tax=Endozoicomonas euniceicola TaxID=1234143 RepID=A0ABY6GPZ4_9GAMM|nr:cardiolipin synthase [Endozoicomonas euniceicola]UYM14825.1 cardiolipin synthase [Endozoicomonas euniceicola]